MGRNYRGSFSSGTVSCVTNGCQLRSRGPKVRCLSRSGAHIKLDWARRVRVYFGVGITIIAVIKRGFMDSSQADQARAEPGGTRTRGSMPVKVGEREGDRAPVCPCLAYLSLHTSELTFRSMSQFRPKRQGRRREGDGTVAMSVQYKLLVCWC